MGDKKLPYHCSFTQIVGTITGQLADGCADICQLEFLPLVKWKKSMASIQTAYLTLHLMYSRGILNFYD
jgi:hypothetical protein